jgi:hypothetical protein
VTLAASRAAWACVKSPAIRALPPVNLARTAGEDTTTPFTEMASSLPGGLSVLIRPVALEGGPLQPVLMTRDKVGEAVRLAHLHSSLPVEGNDALIKVHGCLDTARNRRARCSRWSARSAQSVRIFFSARASQGWLSAGKNFDT